MKQHNEIRHNLLSNEEIVKLSFLAEEALAQIGRTLRERTMSVPNVNEPHIGEQMIATGYLLQVALLEFKAYVDEYREDRTAEAGHSMQNSKSRMLGVIAELLITVGLCSIRPRDIVMGTES